MNTTRPGRKIRLLRNKNRKIKQNTLVQEQNDNFQVQPLIQNTQYYNPPKNTPLMETMLKNSDYQAKIEYANNYYNTKDYSKPVGERITEALFPAIMSVTTGYLTSVAAAHFTPMSTWGTLVKSFGL
jgi:hypothetical protein